MLEREPAETTKLANYLENGYKESREMRHRARRRSNVREETLQARSSEDATDTHLRVLRGGVWAQKLLLGKLEGTSQEAQCLALRLWTENDY